MYRTLLLTLAVFFLSTLPTFAEDGRFRRGDANGDGEFGIADPVWILNYLFVNTSGKEPECLDAVDANDDGELMLSDAVYLLGNLFLGTALPKTPGITCGKDPTSDPLTCVKYAPCSNLPQDIIDRWQHKMLQEYSGETTIHLQCDPELITAQNSEEGVWYYDGARAMFNSFGLLQYFSEQGGEIDPKLGNIDLLSCAHEIADYYRKDFVHDINADGLFDTPGWRVFTHGLAHDCLLFQTPESCAAVRGLALHSAWSTLLQRDPIPADRLKEIRSIDRSREIAYVLQSAIVAAALDRQLDKDADISAYLALADTAAQIALTHVDAWIGFFFGDMKGIYPAETGPRSSTVVEIKSFMIALTTVALDEYARSLSDAPAHAALRRSIQQKLDLVLLKLWESLYQPGTKDFAYGIFYDTKTKRSELQSGPAADLNMLIANAYSTRVTNGTFGLYRSLTEVNELIDQLFDRNLEVAYWKSGKIFSQSNREIFNLVARRDGLQEDLASQGFIGSETGWADEVRRARDQIAPKAD